MSELEFYTDEEIKNNREQHKLGKNSREVNILKVFFQVIILLLSINALFIFTNNGVFSGALEGITVGEVSIIFLALLLTSVSSFFLALKGCIVFYREYVDFRSSDLILVNGVVLDFDRMEALTNILTSDYNDEIKSHVRKLLFKKFIIKKEIDSVASYVKKNDKLKKEEKINDAINSIQRDFEPPLPKGRGFSGLFD